MKRVAIIGTAGRGPLDARYLTPALFEKMCVETQRVMKEDFKLVLGQDDIHLVSGGAAVADHVAVRLFLKETTKTTKAIKLTIFSHCSFDVEHARFDPLDKAGSMSNYYHDLFKKRCAIESLQELKKAVFTVLNEGKKDKASFWIGKGFKDRNAQVAKHADYLIAFTWADKGAKEPLAKSGTMQTWRMTGSHVRKVHVSLQDLV